MCEFCKIDSKFLFEDITSGDVEISMCASIESDGLLSSVFVCGESILSKTTKINYCPICGRKLSEREGTENEL